MSSISFPKVIDPNSEEVSFTKVNDPNSEEVCGICLEPLPKDFVAHGGIHPFDEKCLKIWLAAHPDNPTCPMCRAKVNTQSLFSWKEKLVTEFKNTSFIGLTLCVASAFIASFAFGIPADSMGYSFSTGIKVGILASAVSIVWAHRRGFFRQAFWDRLFEQSAQIDRFNYLSPLYGYFPS